MKNANEIERLLSTLTRAEKAELLRWVAQDLGGTYAGNSGDATKYRSVIAFLDANTLETKFQVSFVGNADIASGPQSPVHIMLSAGLAARV